MAKIGSFGAVKKQVAEAQAVTPVEPDTFDFFDQEFRIATGMVPLLPMMELSDSMQSSGEGSLGMDALGSVWQMLQFCIDERDFPRFRGTAMRHKADLEDDILPLTWALWEAVTSRPSPGPSGSPDGPSTTGTNSRDDSPSPTGQPSLPSVAPPASASTVVAPPRPDMAAWDEQLIEVEELERQLSAA